MAAIGFELLYSSVRGNIKGPSDAVVCSLHWGLISKGFKSVGIGEEAPTNENDVHKSEMLPDGWNDSQDLYTLLYWPSDSTITHLMKIIRMDNSLLVHMLRMSDEKVANMNVDINQYTTSDLSSFRMAFKNLHDLQQRFEKEIINEFSATPKSTTAPSQRQRLMEERPRNQYEDDDPLRVGPARHGRPEWTDTGDPFALGQRDLDPFAGGVGIGGGMGGIGGGMGGIGGGMGGMGGGGMVMDPFRQGMPGRGNPNAGLPGRLPRGAVPPGARFDPFGPPDGTGQGGGRIGPDPDHALPPGYDDMFM